MLGQVEGAPHTFVVEHEEIVIVLQIMDQLDHHILLTVSKRTELPILTLINIHWVVGAELRLVIVLPVQLLHPIMRSVAALAKQTHLIILDIWAQFTRIEIASPNIILYQIKKLPFPIFSIMIEWTLFMIVIPRHLA